MRAFDVAGGLVMDTTARTVVADVFAIFAIWSRVLLFSAEISRVGASGPHGALVQSRLSCRNLSPEQKDEVRKRMKATAIVLNDEGKTQKSDCTRDGSQLVY